MSIVKTTIAANCVASTNKEDLSVNDLLENIVLLLNYIKRRKNSSKAVAENEEPWDYPRMSGEKNFGDLNLDDEALVDASSETTGGHPSQKSLWAQSELTRRLMSSIRDMDETTGRYSRALFALSFVLLVVACLQLIVAIFAPFPDKLTQYVVFFVIIAIISYAFWKVFKELAD